MGFYQTCNTTVKLKNHSAKPSLSWGLSIWIEVGWRYPALIPHMWECSPPGQYWTRYTQICKDRVAGAEHEGKMVSDQQERPTDHSKGSRVVTPSRLVLAPRIPEAEVVMLQWVEPAPHTGKRNFSGEPSSTLCGLGPDTLTLSDAVTNGSPEPTQKLAHSRYSGVGWIHSFYTYLRAQKGTNGGWITGHMGINQCQSLQEGLHSHRGHKEINTAQGRRRWAQKGQESM